MFDHVTCVYVWLICKEKFGGSRWSFSWLSQKVNITIAGEALTGGCEFGPRRTRPNYHVILAWGFR